MRSDGGSLWVDVTAGSTSTQYPLSGFGSATASATTNDFTTSSPTGGQVTSVALDAFLVTAQGAATTLTIFAMDGITVLHTLSIAANQACPLYIPIGGPTGLQLGQGFSFRTGANTLLGELYYRIMV